VKGRNQLEDIGVDGKTIFECIFGKKYGIVWTGFIWLGRDQWQPLVNTVMNFRVP